MWTVSSDNYYDVWNIEGKWYVSMGFASDSYRLYPVPGDSAFETQAEAEKWAEDDYSEYGWTTHPGEYTWPDIARKAWDDLEARTYFEWVSRYGPVFALEALPNPLEDDFDRSGV